MPRDGSNVYHRPPGTDAVTDTTIESSKYNAFVADVEQDLNTPRPIVAGGTGATDAATAITNLGGERAAQVVTNYDSQVFVAGSFYSAATATSAPVTGHAFAGICYVSDAANMVIEARDLDGAVQPGRNWVRQKKAGVWSAWAGDASLYISDTPPVGASDNSLWWESDTGLLFVRYNDGDSTQWVIAMPMPDVAGFVAKAGDTMTGPLVLPGDPTAVLQAAPKQYVDAGVAASKTYADAGDAAINARTVRYDTAQALTSSQLIQARQNIYAAPFDAMAYNGLQINGAMEINQQLSSGSWLALSNYVIDMFKVAFSRAGATFLQQHFASGGPPGLPFCIGAQVSAGAFATLTAADICIFLQYIEGYRCLRLGWGTANAQPITVGFWIYATTPGIATLSVRNNASNRSYVQNFNVNAAATWQYVSLTIPGDTTGTWLTDNNFGLAVGVCVGSGATYQGVNGQWQAGNMMGTPVTATNFFSTNGNVVYLGGLTVHPGSEGPSAARSPLIMRPYDQELQMCKRYFWRTYGIVGGFPYIYSNAYAAAQGIGVPIQFPVPMRALPTLTKFGTWTAQNCPQPAFANASPEGALFYTSSTAAGTVSAYAADATCYLTADARY